MALNAATGSFNVTTQAAGNTVAVTGLGGFQPKVVIFFWNGRTESADGAGRGNLERGFGVAVSATDRFAVASISGDAQPNAVANCAHHAAACILSQANVAGDDGAAAAGDINGAMDLQSMDADGFTLVIDDAFPRDFRVHYLALGGDSLTGQKTGVFTPTGTAPATQAVTVETGFTPTCVIFAGGASGLGTPPDDAADSRMFLGAMTGADGQAVWTGGSNNAAATMNTASYARSGECIARPSASVGAVDDRASFSSFDAAGFTITWAERGGAGRIFYLALKGVDATVGSLLTETNTSTPIIETGFGFAPTAALFVSHAKSESSSDAMQDHDHWSIGVAARASARSAVSTADQDAQDISVVSTASEFDELYINLDPTGTISGLMDLSSFDADGFTMAMDDADPAQAFVWYVAFGPVDAFSPALSPRGQFPASIVRRRGIQHQTRAEPLSDLEVAQSLHWMPKTIVVTGPKAAVVASGMTPPERPQ